MTLTTTGLTNSLTFEGLGIPAAKTSEYFGLWAIEPQQLRSMAALFDGMDVRAHVGRVQEVHAAAGGGRQPQGRLFGLTEGGVAMIQLRGVMMKFVSSLSGGSSTVFARRAVRQAADDPEVLAIMLVIDSPGGTVSGTMDLGTDVAEVAKKKRTVAFVEDLAASAAYWIASQASKVYANSPTALIGSIGTYAVLHDYSKRAEQLGVKVHVIKAGEYKGAGVPGAAVTAEQLEHTQHIVNAANTEFLKAVASGRRMGSQQITAVADGRVHPAMEAKRLGLIDEVKEFRAVVAELEQANRR